MAIIHENLEPVLLYLIAAECSTSTAELAVRLFLPGSVFLDDVMLDLLQKFPTPQKALALSSAPGALRGLPSKGVASTEEEEQVIIPGMSRHVLDVEELRHLVTDFTTDGALVFQGGRWTHVYGADDCEMIDRLTLYRIRPAATTPAA